MKKKEKNKKESLKKIFFDRINSKQFRKTLRAFIIWIIIFALFIYFFFSIINYVQDKMPTARKPIIKGEYTDTGNPAEENDVLLVGNISVT